MQGKPTVKKTKDGVTVETDIVKTNMRVLVPGNPTTNTINYLLNALKRHIPSSA